MKKFERFLKKNSVLTAAFLLIAVFSSCKGSVGLGEFVDLEAPEIQVKSMQTVDNDGKPVTPKTSFETTLYTKQKVTFSGLAYDNNNIQTVYAQIKWLDDDDYHFLKKADLNGNNWTLNIDFEKEGACWLKFIVEDKSKNFGNKSSKVVTLFVDNNPPVIGEAWYIDRKVNGIQYSLQGLDDLKAILAADKALTNPSNKDVAQNGTFYICGSLTDATGIADDELSLSLYDETGTAVKTDISKDTTESSSNYAPKFKIDGEELGLPASGKHFYQIRYSAKDLVTDPAPNVVKNKELEMGWFLWWPESDYPKYSISNVDSDATTITVHTGDSLNITVFDDDALKGEVSCKMTGKITVLETKNISSDTERDCNIILKAPDKPQSMSLVITAKDKYDKAIPSRLITVLVTDDFKPTLILSSPEDNQIPTVTGENGNIHFTGMTLDKSGCTYLEFVWVPDSVTTDEKAKKEKAGEILDSIADSHSSYAPAGSNVVKATTVDGCTVWSAKLTDEGTEGSFQKHSFDFYISLLKDFGSDTIKDKCFVARICREDGGYTDTEFKLAADNIRPEIEVVSPGGNMSIVDKDVDLTLKFRASKSSGVLMKTGQYKITSIDDNQVLSGTYNSAENLYKVTVTKEKLSEYNDNHKNPKFKFEAEDVLGNKNSVEYQYIISALPTIKTITSSAPEKCKLGQEIFINVSFTKPVTCSSDIYLKLKGIKNSSKSIATGDIVRANYYSGSGSATLIFKYVVQPGDTSTELQVYNVYDVEGPIQGLSEENVHLTKLADANNLQEKRSANPITIDGIAPKVSSITVVSSDTVSSNSVEGKKYLKAGRTITATVKTDKKVTVQGTPVVSLKVGAATLELPWQSITDNGTTIKFSKKIESTTTNGQTTFDKTTCFGDTNAVIKDEYGNTLVIPANVSATSDTFVIDTVKPVAPVVTQADGSSLVSGKYMNSVKFKIDPKASSGIRVEYSKDGGSNWSSYTLNSSVELTSDSTLVARVTDYAGNVSDYTTPVNLEINNTFPAYTVECTNSDGNYKAGTTLEFKVNFASPVAIAADSAAYINLSALTGTISSGAKAVLTDASKNKASTTEAWFEYTTKTTDDFTLKIAKGGLVLSGIKDLYGISQGSKTLAADYSRAGLRCDSIAPVISAMVPQGTKTTQNNLNAFSNAKQIKVTFSEPVNVVTGKLYLRQTAGWAIPPMLSASEFNKVLSAVSGVTVTSGGKTLTGSQVLYMDGLEDAEHLYGSLTGAANDRYHGTAQYVGPYKKMTNGINDDGTPNLDVKYVLDFGVDIWNSDDSTKSNFGLTFTPNWTKPGNYESKKAYNEYHHVYQKGWVNVVTPDTVITTDTIRSVLEQVHFHERYMNVNSNNVEASADRKTYTLNFPEGLLGDVELPLGRQWELVIEKGAFMDDTGNYFGAGSSEDMILVKEGSNDSFMSAGVAKPVIRVDRYSYGLGIKQPKSIDGNTITYEQIDVKSTGSQDCINGNGTHAPSALVGVKIDCESRDATIRYAMNSITKTNSDCSGTAIHHDQNSEGGNALSYATTTETSIPANATTGTTTSTASKTAVFLGGSGNYLQSTKQYITADATVNSGAVASDLAKEGIFQTVINISTPLHHRRSNQAVKNSGKSIYDQGDGKQVVNIHGTTGSGGVPSISPFPLRDQAVSSAYMRQTYQKGQQYYWISYETLVEGLYSMYAYGRNAWGYNDMYGSGNSRHWGDWAQVYAKYIPGEYNRCDGMESYLGYDSTSDYNDVTN